MTTFATPSNRRPLIRWLLAAAALLLVGLLVWRLLPPGIDPAVRAHPGARVLDPQWHQEPYAEPPIPAVDELPRQWAIPGAACPSSWGLPPRAQQQCTVLADPSFGEAPTDGMEQAVQKLPLQPAAGTKRVVLLGNSHLQHWGTALRHIAREQGWQLVLLFELGCYLAPPGDPINAEARCQTFWPDAYAAIEPLNPDVLLAIGTKSEYTGETVLQGGIGILQQHLRPGRAIVLLRDTPRFPVDPRQCETAPDSAGCDRRHPVLSTPNPLQPLADQQAGLGTLDLGDLVCPQGSCSPVVGNVRVWMDQHHLTRDYVRTTTDLLRPRVLGAIDKA